ncbi:STAS domain-containing protein [Actinoplanes couchii]|uniref:STAS domain-containing protein n=1 Tax=Actinoplanes couchii TaxID=403638 RepID=UPI001941A4FF|nr:STAS domain-containing protein [Actinoplanes couchii]MDR6324500.1 anti-sigma B factor antagonist [Actinoplanes couchii]
MDQNYFTISSGPGWVNADGIRESLILLAGELDLAARDELRDALLTVIDRDRPGRLIVDLAEVTFIDSEAISALLDGFFAAQNTGTIFRLINVNTMIQRVLRVLDLQDLFHLDIPRPRQHPGAAP